MLVIDSVIVSILILTTEVPCIIFQTKHPPHFTMPKIRRSRKPPPEGWELIEPTLEVVIPMQILEVIHKKRIRNVVLHLLSALQTFKLKVPLSCLLLIRNIEGAGSKNARS